MIKHLSCAVGLLGLALTTASVGAPADELIVFKQVRLLTITDRGMIEGSVMVSGDRIRSIASPGSRPPPGTRVIDGEGKVLMPGLADMHVHYFSADMGPLFLANSVTTVRNLWGTAQTLILDAQAKAGTVPGPHIYTSGPLMDGPEAIWGDASMQINTPEQAVGAVESQRTTGYRAVKLYEGLVPEVYRAAVAAAKERDMQVWTHTPTGLSVEDVLALGVDSLEHFNDVEDLVYDAAAGAADAGYFTRWAQAHPARMQALARKSAESGTWHSPTLTVIAKRYEIGADPDAFFAGPLAGFIAPGTGRWWRGSAERMSPYDDEKRAAAAAQRGFLKMLHDAGASLLVGTDTPNPFVVPGFAIHDELAAFVAAGIPVAEVLRIATAEAARFLREDGQWGVIAPEARADLVLLDADPREDLSTLRRPAGVMVNGHWYPADRLADLLEQIREKNARTAAQAETQGDQDGR